MFNNENIELNSNEMISYIIIDILRRKLREIETAQDTITEKDFLFASEFTKYQEEDWKELYEKIIGKLKEMHRIYLRSGIKHTLKDIKGIVLSAVKDKENIEDCDLHTKKYGDIIIFDDSNSISIVDNNKRGSLPIKQSSNKKPEYILNGDKERLRLSRTLTATIQAIENFDSTFTDLNLLKEGFCEEYHTDSNIDKKEIENVFDEEIKSAERSEKIIIDAPNNAYFSIMSGINSYKITHQPECTYGIKYAERILSKRDTKEDDKSKSKNLKGVKQNDKA